MDEDKAIADFHAAEKRARKRGFVKVVRIVVGATAVLLALFFGYGMLFDAAGLSGREFDADVESVDVSAELRSQALDAAARAETAGRPAQEAWERALTNLGPAVGEECPAEALAAPRREALVMARARRFDTDLLPRIGELVERRYARTVPLLAHAESLRFFLERGDVPRLRAALAEEVPPVSTQFIAVLVVETLHGPAVVDRDTYRSGHLVGRAYLLDADLEPLCATGIDSSNMGIIHSESNFLLGDDFAPRALFQLFDGAQAHIDEHWDPMRHHGETSQ